MNREGAPGKSPEEMYIQQKVRVLLMLRKMGSNVSACGLQGASWIPGNQERAVGLGITCCQFRPPKPTVQGALLRLSLHCTFYFEPGTVRSLALLSDPQWPQRGFSSGGRHRAAGQGGH